MIVCILYFWIENKFQTNDIEDTGGFGSPPEIEQETTFIYGGEKFDVVESDKNRVSFDTTTGETVITLVLKKT